MDAASTGDETTSGTIESWPLARAPMLPDLDVAIAWTPEEIDRLFRGGEPQADVCERFLASASRARGALDLALAGGSTPSARATGSPRSPTTSATTPARRST